MTQKDEALSLFIQDGKVVDRVNVSIGPQFLNLFSKQLYSSPNKAFEELVANSWDAGATTVYVYVPDDLTVGGATVWVLDNGESMDVKGFSQLWSVANSPKLDISPTNGRPQIGKFGIGKLATYVLANELTYICRAKDGVVRSVTMDYRRIDRAPDDRTKLHIDPLPLDVRELKEGDLQKLLSRVPSGEKILDLINKGVSRPNSKSEWQNEYGGVDDFGHISSNTWTLAILSSLKDAGKKMQSGWIRRLLRTALPLGESILVSFNNEVLTSTKIDIEAVQTWEIGPGLGIQSIELPRYTTKEGKIRSGETRNITGHAAPYPHVRIEGIKGNITGRITLYADKISGGKSETVSHSNGFFVNILGRVINPRDPYFGLENLNHSAWAKFRATVRFDTLNDNISISREELQESLELFAFRSFLRALFNKVRNEHDKLSRSSWPNAGEVLTETWADVPIAPLRSVINERAGSVMGLPDFVTLPDEEEVEEVLEEWNELAEISPGNLIERVEFDSQGKEEPLARYDLKARSVQVNFNHPFALEHGDTNEEQSFVRDIALVHLLTDFHMLDIGIHDELVRQTQWYRDQMLRTVAQRSRKSGIQIAQMLDEAATHTDYKALERIVGDALEYIGYSVQRLGNPGEPEGIAFAPLTPRPSTTGKVDPDEVVAYSFNYDAKSSSKGKSKTGNLTTAGVKRHRQNHQADFSLIVAPDYQVADKLLKECENEEITPIRAKDLGRLVMFTAAYGPIGLEIFRPLFALRNPDDVTEWISKLSQSLKEAREGKPVLTLEMFVDALESVDYQCPNSIHVSNIAMLIKQRRDDDYYPNRTDIASLVGGLQILFPSLIRLTTDQNIILSISPKKLYDVVRRQVSQIPKDYQVGLLAHVDPLTE